MKLDELKEMPSLDKQIRRCSPSHIEALEQRLAFAKKLLNKVNALDIDFYGDIREFIKKLNSEGL